jgi:hypothetical protein
MTAMQVLGSVVAIPVGLGSAYSVYRANFSVDTTCQTLRAGIISMIDKKIDATARRMLVRHDVETFEKVCGSVDPDAAAAFKTLLAAGTAPAARRVEAPAKAEARSEAKPAPAKVEAARAEPAKDARKVELRAAAPAEPAKERSKEIAREPVKETPKDASRAAALEAPAPQHDAASDARWLEAVRGALVAHEKSASGEATADVTVTRGAPPHPLGLPPPPVAAAPVAAAPAATAPALPPPTQVSEPVRVDAAAAPADPDRPVPPASIPEQADPKPSGWLSQVPFVGQVLAK